MIVVVNIYLHSHHLHCDSWFHSFDPMVHASSLLRSDDPFRARRAIIQALQDESTRVQKLAGMVKMREDANLQLFSAFRTRVLALYLASQLIWVSIVLQFQVSVFCWIIMISVLLFLGYFGLWCVANCWLCSCSGSGGSSVCGDEGAGFLPVHSLCQSHTVFRLLFLHLLLYGVLRAWWSLLWELLLFMLCVVCGGEEDRK